MFVTQNPTRLFLAALLFAPLLTGMKAKADYVSDEAFREHVETLAVHSNAMNFEVVYDAETGRSLLPKEQLAAFNQIADEQVQIWGDTILEGDYESANPTRVDQIEALRESDGVVVYRVTYSQQAWDTSTCSYTGEQKELKDCEEGRIQEASFVAPDLASWIRDPNSYAEFQSK